ncbi:RNA-directed DNA polymerase, eukaryota, reverse transcriptase zinc-binding domain protein, partial [Tanacetum coccineum]
RQRQAVLRAFDGEVNKGYSHNDSLWSRVIKAIYGVDGEVNKVSKYASRSCWRDIINEVRKLKDQGINMRDFMYIKVGNGETTKFWDDIWIGSKPLKLLFPRIYALDNIKDASICMKLNEPSLDNNFRRSIRGGIEQSQFKKLTDLLIPIVLNPCPDRWFWSLEGSGEFSVASIRRFIDDQRLLTVDSKTLWIKSVPIKVNILAWKIKLEALPTRFNISRRGIEIDSILCPICDRGVESTRHIFFSCCLVRQIARKICSWWDIEYSDVNSFTEWINWMASLRLQSKVKMMIQGVFFVVWWLVWSYRNKLLFEEKKPSNAIIFDDVVSISFYWCKSRCKASFSWDDWLKNPSLISLKLLESTNHCFMPLVTPAAGGSSSAAAPEVSAPKVSAPAKVEPENVVPEDTYLDLTGPNEVVATQLGNSKRKRLGKQTDTLLAKQLRKDHPSFATGTAQRARITDVPVYTAAATVTSARENVGITPTSDVVGSSQLETSEGSDDSFYEMPALKFCEAKRWYFPTGTLPTTRCWMTFNVGAARQICLESEVRSRAEHELELKEKLKGRYDARGRLLEEKDLEILKPKSLLAEEAERAERAETAEVVRFCDQMSVLTAEVSVLKITIAQKDIDISLLDSRATHLKSALDDSQNRSVLKAES